MTLFLRTFQELYGKTDYPGAQQLVDTAPSGQVRPQGNQRRPGAGSDALGIRGGIEDLEGLAPRLENIADVYDGADARVMRMGASSSARQPSHSTGQPHGRPARFLRVRPPLSQLPQGEGISEPAGPLYPTRERSFFPLP